MSYQQLVTYATELEDDYQDDEGAELWENSPFAWIRDNKSATIGAIGRRLSRSIFQNAGVSAIPSNKRLRIGNAIVIVKFSLEWTGGGFVFEQFKNINFDYAFCLGLRPDNALGWLIPSSEIIDDGVWQTRDGLRSQHTGATGNETAWLSVNPDDIQDWLSPFGGSIQFVEQRIATMFGSTA